MAGGSDEEEMSSVSRPMLALQPGGTCVANMCFGIAAGDRPVEKGEVPGKHVLRSSFARVFVCVCFLACFLSSVTDGRGLRLVYLRVCWFACLCVYTC